MHFRFGDYISLQHYYHIISYMYFVNAICSLANKLDDKGENIEDYQILYFCEPGNDIYVNQFLKTLKKISNIRSILLKFPTKSLIGLNFLLCLVVITLSLPIVLSPGGAYFLDKSDKIVFCPEHWFVPR